MDLRDLFSWVRCQCIGDDCTDYQHGGVCDQIMSQATGQVKVRAEEGKWCCPMCPTCETFNDCDCGPSTEEGEL